MSDDNLLIKIDGDPSGADDALSDIGSKAKDLSDSLSELTELAAVGFAAMSAAIGYSVVQAGEADDASQKLSASLQAQGIFTEALVDQYGEYATAVSLATGYDEADITAAQAKIQQYLGEQEVTEDLTQAIADYAAAKGIDLVSAATKLGAALDGNAQRMKQEGLIVDTNMTEQERYGKVLDFVSSKYGGQAEAANQGLGSVKGLTSAFNELAAQIGEVFEPVITEVITVLTNLFNYIRANPALTEFIAVMLAAGAAVAGVVTFLGAAVAIAPTVIAAVAALGVSFNVAFVGIPLLIGAVVAAIVLLATNWDSVSSYIRQVVGNLGTYLATALGGISQIFQSIFHFDLAGIKAGLAQVGQAMYDGTMGAWKQANVAQEQGEEEQDEDQAAYHQKVNLAKQIDNKNKIAQQTQFRKDIAALDLNYDSQDDYHRTDTENKALEKLQLSIKTERDAITDEENRKLKIKIDSDNKLAAETQRYGAVAATIDQALHSTEIQGANTAAGDLVGLAQSKNATLAAIGKAASITQIGIKTAEGAVGVYTAFLDTIPFPPVAIPLGIAAAAAVVAYGAEQIGNVTSAAQGGLLEGGTPGTDSIPVLGMPGELVVPNKNFDEVVNAVASQRSGAAAQSGAAQSGAGQQPTIVNHFHGDTIGDPAYVNKMITQINKAVLYRNAQVLTRPGGVTG